MTFESCSSTPRRRRLAAVLTLVVQALVVALVLGARPAGRPRMSQLQSAGAGRAALGDSCVIRADGRSQTNADRLVAAALDSIAALESVFGHGAPGSEMAALDGAPPETRITCSRALWSALGTALAVAGETGGAYDPTALPLVRAWRDAAPMRPDEGALGEARRRSGYAQLGLEPGTASVRFPRAGMAIDLDGVARGMALDRAVDQLRAGGMRRARLDFGDVSEVFADEGDSWGVPVADPTEPERTAVTITARRSAVATAPFEPAMIDPRSGRTVLRSSGVTVVTGSAARAQALARALRVLGRDEAERFALAHRDIGVLWLEPDGSTLQAWRWNLTLVTADPAVVVRWMP
jgi:thiamine biosynthesis lipoprotein